MKLGLVPKIIIGIILGTLIGQYMPTEVCRLVVTLSGIFSNFLKFVIPMMILAYVTMGIADPRRRQTASHHGPFGLWFHPHWRHVLFFRR